MIYTSWFAGLPAPSAGIPQTDPLSRGPTCCLDASKWSLPLCALAIMPPGELSDPWACPVPYMPLVVGWLGS